MQRLLFGVIATVMVSGLLLGSMGSDVFALSEKGAEKGQAKSCNDDNPGKAKNNPHCLPTCDEPLAWYWDDDGDGWGAGDPVLSCDSPGDKYVNQDGDCDDFNGTINPGAGNCS
jgi:hypothetical protein